MFFPQCITYNLWLLTKGPWCPVVVFYCFQASVTLLKKIFWVLFQTCIHSDTVTIILNALVVLRDPITPSNKTQEPSTPLDEQRNFKLNLYTVGFILSWDIYSGDVEILKTFDLVEGPGTLVK